MMVLWLSGPDSIKAPPGVTYDLILFVIKNTDSIQLLGDVTVKNTDESGVFFFSPVNRVEEKLQLMSLPVDRGEAAATCRKSDSRARGTYVSPPLWACTVL